jgi:hypothetical protein
MNLASPHIDRAALLDDELTPTRETVTDALHKARAYILGIDYIGAGYVETLDALEKALGIGRSARNFKEGQTV